MDIAVIGTGYVGLVTGACLSELGHNVTCIDVDEEKVAMMKKGISPIYEDGLTELLEKNIEAARLHFTTDYTSGLSNKQVVYLAVGTPEAADGSADLTYIDQACESISHSLEDDIIVVTKSTVPVGTNEYIKEKIESKVSEAIQIKIVSNPEFLRQGTAVHDTFYGDRIVIGSDNKEALKLIREINEPFNIPIVETDLRSAEMIKYASNAFLATKISFINEIANLSERVGANIDHIAQGMGMDKRIGNDFLNAGVGYGGSCFPKDTEALIAIGEEANCNMEILKSTDNTNDRQKEVLVNKVMDRYHNIEGKRIAVLGLAFKPNTDDMREAPSILITQQLLKNGAEVYAYDPVAQDNAKKILSSEIQYVTSIEEAVQEADIAIILTEWKEIQQFPLKKYEELMADAVLFDGRNCFTLEEAEESAVEYHSIGRKIINKKAVHS